ncbi:MAG: hypothetical protein ABW321_18745, partial [Polyangiales bacterium]
AAGGDDAAADSGERVPAEIETGTLGSLTAADYDRRGELPLLAFSFDTPPTHGDQPALLRQLGKPAAWSGEGSPADILAPLVRAAAAHARRIALAEQAPAEPSAAEPSATEPSATEPSATESLAPARTRAATPPATDPQVLPRKKSGKTSAPRRRPKKTAQPR